ncbi:MAG: hypothetical protein H6719_32690 [Sandaracinaceae bacterium]|nr:hypothetical protein [Sandaracinaceae bacterium]
MRTVSARLLALGLLVTASAVVAQTPSVPSTLEGAWRRQPSATEARRTVIAAFEPRLEVFPEMLRGIARDRITESLPMADRIEIAVAAERVRVAYVTQRRVVIDTPLGGSARVRLEDGDERRAVQRLRGGWLEQVFTDDQGRVERLLSTEPDGSTLHLDYTVHNSRLGAPVRWRIDYRR